MGKGSKYRPVDKKKYDRNYERIFGKTQKYPRERNTGGIVK